MTRVPPTQFAVFRILFGVFLALYLARLLPWAQELFGAEGLPSAVGSNPTPLPLPNLLELAAPAHPSLALSVLLVCAAALAAGVGRRLAALVLWYGWACLYDVNPLILNPSLAYVGWLCLACVLVPPGEGLGLLERKARESWRLPGLLWIGAWVVMAVAYSVSGLDKLTSEAWREGSALRYVAGLPYARDGIARELLVSSPEALTRILTWGALLAELLFAPLCLARFGRRLAWLAAVLLHAGVLVMLDFWELTVGVLMMHAFTFDARWLPRSLREASRAIPADPPAASRPGRSPDPPMPPPRGGGR